jgi:hypothetical protein
VELTTLLKGSYLLRRDKTMVGRGPTGAGEITFRL